MIAAGDQSRDWHIRQRQLTLMHDVIPLSILRNITAPTRIIAADGDSIRLEHIVEIYRGLPDAHLFVIPEAAHNMLPDERYNLAIERFLTRPFTKPDEIVTRCGIRLKPATATSAAKLHTNRRTRTFSHPLAPLRTPRTPRTFSHLLAPLALLAPSRTPRTFSTSSHLLKVASFSQCS